MQPGAVANGRPAGFFTLATFVIVVAILRIAEDVLIPIALAVLLAFLLSPLVVRLTRWGLSNTMATIAAVTLAFAVIASVGWLVAAQFVHLVNELPKYEENIRRKVRSLTALQGTGSLSRTSGMVEKLQKELEEPQGEANPTPGTPARTPVPVEVTDESSSPMEVLRDIAGPIAGPLGTGGIVIVFAVAMLLQRQDLRDRFIKVVSAGRINIATQAVDDAARRVSRYLGMQLVVNATYGIPAGIGLHLIGIPSALLWGLLATLLRFIPFLGPWIAASFPVAISLAVDPGWTKLLLALGLFIVLELVSNNIVEVWLYGTSTGISNVALLVAAVFWTWLWGTAGLFLSTPLTVCLLVLGRHVPGLTFLSELLGSGPVLKPPTHFYQRMLSMDYDQVADFAVRQVEERSLTTFYEEVFVPALILAEEDRHAGTLAEIRQRFILQAGRELIEDLGRRATDAPSTEPPAGENEPPPGASSGVVLGLPARDDADELVALMLRHLLRDRGISAEVVAVTAAPAEVIASLDRSGAGAAFISALPPSVLLAARQACRRIKEARPALKLVVGVWTNEAGAGDLRTRFRERGPDEVVTRLSDAVRWLESATHSEPPPPLRPSLEEKQAGVEVLQLDEAVPAEWIDAVIRDLAQAFGVPVSLVKLVPFDRGFWTPFLQSRQGEVEEQAETLAFLGQMLPGETLLEIEDVGKDRRLSSQPLIADRGIRFCVAAPLRAASGHLVGGLFVVDTKARSISDRERAVLRQRATELMGRVDRHAARTQAPAPPGEDPAEAGPKD